MFALSDVGDALVGDVEGGDGLQLGPAELAVGVLVVSGGLDDGAEVRVGEVAAAAVGLANGNVGRGRHGDRHQFVRSGNIC